MTRVTAAVFHKEVGRFRSIAHREPVVITNHGRPDVVMLSNEEYERLKELDRQSLYAWEMGQASIKAIAEAEPSPEADALNHLLD